MEVNEFEKAFRNKPQLALLGAGATVTSIPKGDKNGISVPVMLGLIQKLGMSDFLKRNKSQNKERQFGGAYIFSYFRECAFPNYLTVYDFLLLSLKTKI